MIFSPHISPFCIQYRAIYTVLYTIFENYCNLAALKPKIYINIMSPEVIAQLDAIKVNMNEAGMNAINIVLAFVMFGVALGIKPKTFVDVVKKPQSVLCHSILRLSI